MKQQIKKQMSKKKFRIGELARELEVKKFVIRFWEKEFDLKSDRSQGGQRYYTQDDFKAFNTIKFLLYKQGFTIAGAKIQLEKILTGQEAAPKQETQSAASPSPAAKAQPSVSSPVAAATRTVEKVVPYIPQEFLKKVGILKEKLVDLQQKLN